MEVAQKPPFDAIMTQMGTQHMGHFSVIVISQFNSGGLNFESFEANGVEIYSNLNGWKEAAIEMPNR